MAFFSLMKELNIGEGDEVILQGATCSVMPNAVLRTGAKPVFADVDPDTFGSSAEHIEQKITLNTKMIVAQHSFGILCKIDEIVKIGKKHGIFILEDSAISLGSSLDTVSVGNWGDAALFSTDHSKPLNTLIGGFLYTKNKDLFNRIKKHWENIPQLSKDHQRRLFTRLLFERKYYNPSKYAFSGLILFLRKKLKIDRKTTYLNADYSKKPSLAIDHYPYPAKLPAFLAQLGLYELERWDIEKERRKNLLNDFITISERMGVKQYLPAAYFDSRLEIVPLRFVFTHPESEKVRKRMSQWFNIDWFWFMEPIVACKDPRELGYEYGSCKISEEIGKKIINWPCVLIHVYDYSLSSVFQRIFS